jgi:hypothetical protein
LLKASQSQIDTKRRDLQPRNRSSSLLRKTSVGSSEYSLAGALITLGTDLTVIAMAFLVF